MKPKRERPELDGFALLDESVQLLRGASPEVWAIYLLGVLPFGVGALWFWTDGVRSLYARESLTTNSLVMAILFCWKQVCESLFVARLHASLTDRTVSLTAGDIVRIALRQLAIQPLAWLTLPLAAVAILPVPQVLFFHRNLSLTSVTHPSESAVRSWALARQFTRQAWVLLGVLSLAGLLLYGNFFVAAIFAAQLAKSFFGIESLVTDPLVLSGSFTLHFVSILGAYICLDALLGAATALRCFHGESIRTGEDILALARRTAVTVAAVVLLVVAVVPPAEAQTESGVDAQALDEAIEQTLRQHEFSWRMPAEEAKPPEAVSWIYAVLKYTGRFLTWIFESIIDWLTPDSGSESGGAKGGALGTLGYWMIGLAVIALGALVTVILRERRRNQPATAPDSIEVQPVDVGDETVLADQLPEDSWLSMADDLLARGDLRLALRALHLAGLRMLAGHGLVRVARWKSGLEYFYELRRRSGQKPELSDAFVRNLRIFELGWYSRHDVQHAMIEEFRERLQEMRVHAR